MKKVGLICAAFLTLSASMLFAGVTKYPQQAEALAKYPQNYSHTIVHHLPNGYRIGVSGLSQVVFAPMLLESPFGTSTSANISVQVVKVDKRSNSSLKSFRIIHTTTAFVVNALNITAPAKIVNYELATQCGDIGYSLCTLQKSGNISGVSFIPTVSAKIELTFNDGVRTIYIPVSRLN